MASSTPGVCHPAEADTRCRWCDLGERQLSINASLQRVDVELVRTAPKTMRSTRVVPLGAETVARLRRMRRAQAERLLALGIRQTDETPIVDNGAGGFVDPIAYTRAWPEIATQAAAPGVRLHDARHGVATLLRQRGLRTEKISKTLGHSTESFTLQTYVHVGDDELAEVADAISDALGG